MNKNADINQKRTELETLYTPFPPMHLLYRIIVGGTLGVFLAVILVRSIFPNKLPIIVYPQQKHERLDK